MLYKIITINLQSHHSSDYKLKIAVLGPSVIGFPAFNPYNAFIILQNGFLWLVAWEIVTCLVKFCAIFSKQLETTQYLFIIIPDDNSLDWFVSRLDCHFCQLEIRFILSCTAIFKYKVVLNILLQGISDSNQVIFVAEGILCWMD